MATAIMEHKAPENYHPENIEGKAVIVTGGTTGIGRAIAKLLAERGARVLIYGRDEQDLQEALNELEQSGEVLGVNADQSRLEDIQHVFEEADARLGGLDILVNNAAVSAGSVLENSLDELSYGITTNLTGYVACTKHALERMKPQGHGHIICVGSMSADLREEGNDVYVATKAGIQAFSESLRKEVNPLGIKVSLIEPGLVESDMTGAKLSEREKQEKIDKGEMLEPMDIAEAVHYCLTQPARCDVVLVQIRPICQAI